MYTFLQTLHLATYKKNSSDAAGESFCRNCFAAAERKNIEIPVMQKTRTGSSTDESHPSLCCQTLFGSMRKHIIALNTHPPNIIFFCISASICRWCMWRSPFFRLLNEATMLRTYVQRKSKSCFRGSLSMTHASLLMLIDYSRASGHAYGAHVHKIYLPTYLPTYKRIVAGSFLLVIHAARSSPIAEHRPN